MTSFEDIVEAFKDRPQFLIGSKGVKLEDALSKLEHCDEWFERTGKLVMELERELREKLEKEQGLVTLNDDGSVKDVLIGIKELLRSRRRT